MILNWIKGKEIGKKFDILLFPDENGKMTKEIPLKLLMENGLFQQRR